MNRNTVLASGLFLALGSLFYLFPNITYASGSCSLPGFTKGPTVSEDFVNYRGVTFGDFNGDGKADMAAAALASGSSGTVRVYLGDGLGGFGSSANFQTGDSNGASAITSGDFNRDGKLDLAAANFNSISILLGNGAGGFAAGVMYGVGAGPSSIAVGDFNRDGFLDLATANSVSGNLTLLFGDGAGRFGDSKNIPVVANPRYLKAADFNNDGRLDLAVSSQNVNGVTVLLGDGAGNFASASAPFSSPNRGPAGIDAGDFDGDGALDLAVVNGGANEVVIWHGDGVGRFGSPVSFSAGFGARFVLTADFDGDGRLDLFVTNIEGNNISILRGLAGGLFAPQRIFVAGLNPSFAAVADLNGDGKLDAGVANITAISILQGDGAGGFQAPEAYPVSDNFNVGAVSLVEGDYDSDGKVDLAVARSDGIALLQNDGSGRFQRKFIGPVASGGQSGSIVTSDFNRDGKLDLAVTEGSRVTTFLGDGAGGFTRRSTTQVDTSPVSLYVADFNNDGIDDLVTPTFGGSSASLLLGDGTGAFVRKTVAGFGVQVNVIAVGDFNRDGNADLVGQKPFINPTFADVTIFLGDGTGNFTQSPNGAFTTSGFPQSILVEDFNGDGKADLVVSVSTGINSTSGLFLLTGDGAGGLGPPVQISGSDATSLVSGDFNADGNLDIAGSAGDLAFVMLGDGGGNFGQRVTFPVGRAPRRLRAADFNGDGKADLATANGSGDATVLFNTCAFAPAPLPSLSVGDATASEGDAGVVNATFNVQLSAPSSKTVTVSYYALGLSAAKGSDFQTVAGSLTFNPGVTSQTFTVPVVGDTLDEFDEKFAVRLAFPLGANVSRGQAEGTIIDNDPPPSASVGDVTLNEGNAGTTAAAFNVSLSAPSGKPISLSFATADNSATAGADYQPTGGTLTFNPGETSKTIIIPVVGETVFETDETFFVNLNDPVNVTVARGQAVGLILNDDPQPAISVADASKAESNAGASDLIFTVTLSNASFQSVTVVYATADDTATSPSDYQAVNGTLTFAPGETARTISVPVAGDSAVEADEKFFVNLSSPFNATLADAQGVGSILNDDTSVQFSAGAQAVNETDGSIQVFITRVGLLSGVSTVNYLTRDGAASERSDYNPALGTLRFAPNETSKTVTIFITDDALVESPETFSVALSNPNGCAIGSPSVASITINSDDVTAGPNPADSSSFFVRQHYRDFLNREPDEAGLNFWTGEVEGCGQNAECREVKRINVSAAFFLSIEFQETGYFVYRIYKAAYGDTTSPNVAGPAPGLRLQEFLPDSQRIGQGVQVGIGDWQQQLEANKQAYLVEFVTRPRFTVAFPATLTPAQFVDQLNRNAGAVLSPAERDALVSELAGAPDQTQGRAAALRGVAEEAELRRREQNRAFVLMQYYGYLRRNPDDTPDSDFSGWKFWLSKLEQFGGNFVQAEMVKAFISSTEYRQRFGQP